MPCQRAELAAHKNWIYRLLILLLKEDNKNKEL
jgi:hypothetical protein